MATKEEQAALFERIGLSAAQAKKTTDNARLAESLVDAISLAGVDPAKGCDKELGVLLHAVASTKLSLAFPLYRKRIVEHVVKGELPTTAQVSAAAKFLQKEKDGNQIDETAFAAACDLGKRTTDEEVRAAVAAVIEENKQALLENRYRATGRLLGQITKRVPFGDGKVRKVEFDKQILALLGPRTEADNAKPKKQKKNKNDNKKKNNKNNNKNEEKEEEKKEEVADLAEGRLIPWALNTEEQKQKHLEATGGRVQTRFPPEPNGFLHLGHAKAINFNFGVAAKAGGVTYLRFDDTNPTAEKKVYIDHIKEIVSWLGFKPWKVTYSSDYFPQLYDLAVKMIKDGNAFVCHQTKAQMEKSREDKTPSPWCDRSVEENLKLFEQMRMGMFDEGAATLRMKGDLTSPNPNLWDPVAYRIMYTEHPHAGDKWVIYPTYDYTHCIVDSLENITHSLCTLEFEVRRESYFWLLNVLDLYKPKVWEYSRLTVEYNVMSKRKLKKLVEGKYVNGWDDPRLITLAGLRRRGYTAEGLRMLCEKVGVTRSANSTPYSLLELCGRAHLNDIARRAMVVVDPVRVTITNLDEGHVQWLEAPNHPKNADMGTHKIPLTRTIFIERDDFQMNPEKGFYRLSVGASVLLKYVGLFTCTHADTDASGRVTHIRGEVKIDNAAKAKGKIHWVADPAAGHGTFRVELRLYDTLFTEAVPGQAENEGKADEDKNKDAYLNVLNPNSLRVVKNAIADPSLAKASAGDKFQFERVGFFCVDPDSTADHLVCNRTMTLKDSFKKAKSKNNQKKKN